MASGKGEKKTEKGDLGGFLSGALQNVKTAWREVFRFSGRVGNGRSNWSDTMRDRIDACLAGKGGEVSARFRAAELARSYLEMPMEDRLSFLKTLANDYGPDEQVIAQAVDALQSENDPDVADSKRRALIAALKAPRVSLLRKFNALHSGPRFLVQLRDDLMGCLKEHPELKPLDTDLKELLMSWFDVGFLDLKSINWNSSAALLEKLVNYEAVHRVRGWQDMKNRLDTDRRCFAFFHPCMPDEPLIFIEVALVNGLASQVQTLLDEKQPALDADQADTAIFYSISNTQRGLAGISFGNFLIKQVVDYLRREQPNLKRFSTLSPVPGFRRWLDAALKNGGVSLLPKEAAKLKSIDRTLEPIDCLKSVLTNTKWARSEDIATMLEPILTRWCAVYLQNAKRGESPRAMDPVAHFHLTNGARIERINWMGDTSAKGIRESAGIMVNYLYQLDQIDRNHENYTSSGKIASSSSVKNQLKKAK